MKNYKSSTKFWLGILIMLILFLFIRYMDLINWTEVVRVFTAIIGILIISFILLLQIFGIILILGNDTTYDNNKNIYQMDANSLPETKIGYLQIPVMLVKFIKHFNNWIDEKF